MNALWKKFWDFDSPIPPTPYQLQDICLALGFDAVLDTWEDQAWGARVDLPEEERIRRARVRLCLTKDRDAELAAALLAEIDAKPRSVATLRWDVQ